MGKKLLEKLIESARSVLPISLIVFVLHFTLAPMPLGTLVLFISGTVLLILGVAIFTQGTEMAMMPMGEFIGAGLTRSRNAWLLLIGSFLLGIFVTLAEPDLQVLTKQVPSIPDTAMIWAVAAGVGLFLMLALLRILLKVKLSYLFIVFYAIVFIVAAVTSPDYLAVAFDAGGVTTGPITVPFILALGAGVSAVRGSDNAEEDSFGLCALCSIGPVLTMLILGVFFNSSNGGYAYDTPSTVSGAAELFSLYGNGLKSFFGEVATALTPVVIIFVIFQLFQKKKLPAGQLIKIGVGVLYTVIGLTIFLVGVNIGFMPAGHSLGHSLASLPYNWILIPLSVVIGFFVVMAEPAVLVLTKQVEEITNGAISKKMMMFGLSAGVSGALALAMLRIMTGVSIWFFLVPGYLIALILSLFVSDVFTAIAFDSGGVAAGSMAAAFLLPFALGACEALGGNIMTDAFGIIAMIAMLPLVSIQIIGLVYKIKLSRIRDFDTDLEAAPAGSQIPLSDPAEQLSDSLNPEDTDSTLLISQEDENDTREC